MDIGECCVLGLISCGCGVKSARILEEDSEMRRRKYYKSPLRRKNKRTLVSAHHDSNSIVIARPVPCFASFASARVSALDIPKLTCGPS
jgi:hypothetical protein